MAASWIVNELTSGAPATTFNDGNPDGDSQTEPRWGASCAGPATPREPFRFERFARSGRILARDSSGIN